MTTGAAANAGAPAAKRSRIRDAVPGIRIGDWPAGPKNGITDVPGVLVSTIEIHQLDGDSAANPAINTGVTAILPRRNWISSGCAAGIFRFNGAGELSSSHWLEETGNLSSPVILTTTTAIGDAQRGVFEHCFREYPDPEFGLGWFFFPTVAETFDGYMNDLTKFAVTPAHVDKAISTASSDPVPEGNRGGGTGMLCHGHKGGTGTSSRVVPGLRRSKDGTAGGAATEKTTYTVGALVQANYGKLRSLHIAGVPVGRILSDEREAAKLGPTAADVAKDAKDGSILVVIATDAPLQPTQCKRLARRATGGLSRVGGYGHNASGDIFLAFSTGNELPVQRISKPPPGEQQVDPFEVRPVAVEVVDDQTMNGLIEAAADATEEAIYNALCMAETMTGWQDRTVEALDLDKLRSIMDKHMYVSTAKYGHT